MSDDKAAVQPESDESLSDRPAETAKQADPTKVDDDQSGNDAADAEHNVDLAAELESDLVAKNIEAASDKKSEETAEPENEIAGLQAQLEQASAKADENMDLALRTRAEMENLRKRQARELENAHKYSLDKIAAELLPVRDTLELGVAAADEEDAELGKIVEGTGLTLKMLTQALEKFNILEVDPLGEKFNPDLHQAISMQEGTDKPANTVLTVMQKGYTLNDRLLRPAMVVIAK